MNKKLLLIIVFVALISFTSAALYFAYQSSITKPVSTILGIQDTKFAEPSVQSNPQSPSLISAITKPLLSSIQNNSTPSNTPTATLEGQGCEQNSTFEKTCTLISSTGRQLILKKCIESDFNNCNFYEFRLGINTGTVQYIIQRYEENGDILTDILEYSFATNTTNTIKTVLFQTLTDGSIEAKNGNSDFTNTLNQYQ